LSFLTLPFSAARIRNKDNGGYTQSGNRCHGHMYPLWYDGQFTTEIWISTLEWLTERYKNDDTILALDLKNEPHGTPGSELMAKWDGSTDLNNWKHAAETCAKRILAINPNILIVVEGVEVYPKPGYDYTAVDEWEKRVNISITGGEEI